MEYAAIEVIVNFVRNLVILGTFTSSTSNNIKES